MKGLYILSILIFSIQVCSAQVFEIAEDRGFYNTFNQVTITNDSVVYITGNYRTINSFFSGAYLKALDNNGALLWEYLSPYDTEVREFSKIFITPDGNIMTLGYNKSCCDCSEPLIETHLFSTNGILLAQNSFESLQSYETNPMSTMAGEVVAVVLPDTEWPATYYLHAIDVNGNLLWSYNLGTSYVSSLISMGNNFLIFSEEAMLKLNSSGEFGGTIPYTNPPERVLGIDNDRAVIITDGIAYELSDDLSVNPVFFESNTNDIEYWIKSGDFIYIIAAGEIRKLNLNYEMEQCTFFESLPDHELNATWCNEEYCVFAGDKTVSFEGYPYDTYHSSAVAYTVMLDNSQMEHFPDVAVRSLSINTININNPETNVYSFTGNVTGYLVNTGDITLESAHVFHFIGPNVACGLELNHIAFENISLQPGDSIEFNIDVEQRTGWYPNDEWIANFCVYATSPNNFSDRDNSNDVGCVSQSSGVGIFENSKNENIGIFPNPAGNQITLQLNISNAVMEYFIVDLSGRTVLSGIIQENTLPEIDITGLENGSYLLQLKTGSTAYSGKFIVVR